jgi:hypothetical protein
MRKLLITGAMITGMAVATHYALGRTHPFTDDGTTTPRTLNRVSGERQQLRPIVEHSTSPLLLRPLSPNVHTVKVTDSFESQWRKRIEQQFRYWTAAQRYWSAAQGRWTAEGRGVYYKD